MKLATICYLIDKKNNKILLGRKKYGITKGILNGFGGHVEEFDKSIKDAAIREFFEETSIKIANPVLSGALFFHYDDKTKDACGYIYLCENWRGKPKESEEMEVEWFNLNNIPVNRMWPDDKLWFPVFLEKQNLVVHSHRNKPGDFPYKVVMEFDQKIFEGMHNK